MPGNVVVMETGAAVDASNVSQHASWDGATGSFWADNADRFDDGVAGYRARFLEAAAIEKTFRVPDVGRGSGQTTRDAVRAASGGSVLGVDLSADMLRLARERAQSEALTNVVFEQVDAQAYPFPEERFDVAISRHGAMFFGEPVRAFANIARSLRSDGRLLLLTWQPFEHQEWLSSFFSALSLGRPVSPPPSDSPSPFALSAPDRVHGLLTSAGLVDVELEGLSAPMYFGATVDDALRFVARQQAGMLDGLSDVERKAALRALETDLTAHLGKQGVHYESAGWLVHARKT